MRHLSKSQENEAFVTSLQRTLQAHGHYHGKIDGWAGNATQAALHKFIGTTPAKEDTSLHHVIASSFADPADVKAFKKCKATGKSDLKCFAVGDNGIGCWGDNTAQLDTPMCALPPDDMIDKFGSIDAAKHKKVKVIVNGKEVICILADRMPWKKNIKNKAGIDLNPAAAKALGLKPPFKVSASWQWA